MNETQNGAAEPARRKKCPKPHERWRIITRGIEEGKSRRQIADELGCDEATVRRDLKKGALPAEEQTAIQEGDSADKYLNAALLRKTGIDRSARNKIGRRRREDERTGKYSDVLARALLDWLSTKKLTDCDTKLVLDNAVHRTESLPDGQPAAQSRRFREVIAPVERDPHSDRRLTSPDPNFMERCATELVRALVRVEPAQVIRKSALQKARVAVKARGHWTDRPEWKKGRDNITKRRNLRGGNQT